MVKINMKMMNLNLDDVKKSRMEDENTLYTDDYLTNEILLNTKNFIIGHCLCDMAYDLNKETIFFIGIDDENSKEQDEITNQYLTYWKDIAHIINEK